MLWSKSIPIMVSLVILISNAPATGYWKENTEAIDISGGENHTLVLTRNRQTWACGPNGNYPYNSFYGVLGTGSADYNLVEKTLVRVHDGAMSTPSDYLEDINHIDAGWMHSMALDANSFVWARGEKFCQKSRLIMCPTVV